MAPAITRHRLGLRPMAGVRAARTNRRRGRATRPITPATLTRRGKATRLITPATLTHRGRATRPAIPVVGVVAEAAHPVTPVVGTAATIGAAANLKASNMEVLCIYNHLPIRAGRLSGLAASKPTSML